MMESEPKISYASPRCTCSIVILSPPLCSSLEKPDDEENYEWILGGN